MLKVKHLLYYFYNLHRDYINKYVIQHNNMRCLIVTVQHYKVCDPTLITLNNYQTKSHYIEYICQMQGPRPEPNSAVYPIFNHLTMEY